VNVTLTLSTPEHPEAHAVNFDHVETLRYTTPGYFIDAPPPGLYLRLRDRIERFDTRCVLDVLVG